ncbi:hypothetical protein CPB84DRAFT_1894730 [Gymnopilus junonius]|uniref:Uncharacterized protein n=1 Tax=Gymnopilus junonius TaxID=109634 RepID=A0A9P5TR41_GYMJU|nr:hypothetical protein CPB84DRAFT_1894730 [Gymnopilus junonius]
MHDSQNFEFTDVPLLGPQSFVRKTSFSTFGQLMDEVVGDSALSLKIKKTEVATKDLTAFKSDTFLTEYLYDVEKVGRGMQKFTSKVGGAVDRRAPFVTCKSRTMEFALEETVGLAEAFDKTIDALADNMEGLVIQAEVNYQALHALEDQLANLQEFISYKNSSLVSAKKELLVDLWTKLRDSRKSSKIRKEPTVSQKVGTI